MSISGTNPGDYVFASNACSNATLVPNGNCIFSVSFQPMTTGTRAAVVSVPSNVSGGPQSVALQGDGASPPPVAVCGTPPRVAALVQNTTGGLYAASVGPVSEDAITRALDTRITISAERLNGFAGIGFGDGLPFWLTVISKPDQGVTLSAVSLGGRFGFVAPGVDAVYDASFCRPSSLEFDLALDGAAIERTAAAFILGELASNVPKLSYADKVVTFVARARERVPLFDEAFQHFTNAAAAQSARTRAIEFSTGLRSIRALSARANAGQLRELLLVVTDVGVESTLSTSLEALIKLEPNISLWQALRRAGVLVAVAQVGIDVASMPLAYEILMLQTGGNLAGPGPMIIRIRSQ